MNASLNLIFDSQTSFIGSPLRKSLTIDPKTNNDGLSKALQIIQGTTFYLCAIAIICQRKHNLKFVPNVSSMRILI